ncbi:hypothetical protein Ciccas_014205, partial [Cichlidogyrus casuarinus]
MKKDPQELDTDDEIEEIQSKGTKKSLDELLAELPDFFKGKHFMIYDKDLSQEETRMLKRLIITFDGQFH